MAVKMELARVLIRETQDSHVVELREVDGERVFPIVIGLSEAAAIERRVMGQKPPRPQTHDLLASVIEALDADVDKVVITDLQEGTFFASLVLKRQGQEIIIDSRPSDAIALGVATDVPIFVEEAVLEEIYREEGEQ
jgi:bifunctional DNase/RNase